MADEFERSEQPARRWPTQGVFIVPLAVGDVVGRPLSEPAHITPRFPQGIKDSDLWIMDRTIQMETALWWFLLNLEPYDADKAAAKFGQARFGDSFSRPAVAALDVLRDEFKSVLLPELIEDIARRLEGLWMWKTQQILPAGLAPTTANEVFSALLPVLEGLASAITNLPHKAAHGGIGHNGPDDDAPLSDKDRAKLLVKIKLAKKLAQQSNDEAPLEFLKVWRSITAKLKALSKWVLKQIDMFVSNFMVEAGKSAGRWVGPVVAACLIGHYAPIVFHFHVGDALVEVLRHLPLH